MNFNVSVTDRSRLGANMMSDIASSSTFSNGKKVKPSSANNCAVFGAL